MRLLRKNDLRLQLKSTADLDTLSELHEYQLQDTRCVHAICKGKSGAIIEVAARDPSRFEVNGALTPSSALNLKCSRRTNTREAQKDQAKARDLIGGIPRLRADGNYKLQSARSKICTCSPK